MRQYFQNNAPQSARTALSADFLANIEDRIRVGVGIEDTGVRGEGGTCGVGHLRPLRKNEENGLSYHSYTDLL